MQPEIARTLWAIALPLSLWACSTGGPSAAPDAAAAPAASVAPVEAPPASSEPEPSPEKPSAAASVSAEPGPEEPPPEEALPAVEVKNIGMHIGGGPNDKATKSPIHRSVNPHMEAFQRCYAKVEEPKKGDFGVDLRIEREGGKAKASHPRTSLKGDDFKQCVMDVFGEIDFLKPKTGTTVVSYSLRFTPTKD